MKTKVLIAHAKGEENLAEQLAEPIRAAGYEVAHEGTVLVGESVVAEASKLLSEGVPVILCGTVRAVGTKWGRQVFNAARRHNGVRVFVVQMEEEADVDVVSFDETIARYWQDSSKAEQDLIAALKKFYPPEQDPHQNLRVYDLESRYRELALKACDIIDLANLPEDDRYLASRELELRRLYVALRMRLEIQAGDKVDDEKLKKLESRRIVAWGESRQISDDKDNRFSLGERLQISKRLVVLGDPGAGKSTLLRWLATAYLLRLRNDPDWGDLPDINSLPETQYLPILVRCRDLPQNANTLDEMLYHSLRKSELAESECTELSNLLRNKLQDGTALLLVDGLDEITEPSARARFSQQLEQIHRVFPNASIIVTSRIVGYREMGYRIRAGFEHLTVADLSIQDKDDFARRWCALTERAERRDAAAEELIRDIHSRDRIERLTGNPMLLTTMALIKRKIGRLPQRRVDLYEKAVEVLLNWRSAVDDPLDAREALPQLEYLAHAMCAEGIQQIQEDRALKLLRLVRTEYPNIHPLTQHTPEEFLCLLERRTGLLIQTGHVRHNGHSVPVYEFRHLTFQEYLAGLALVQGHYQIRDKSKSLAEVIAPLAGQVKVNNDDFSEEPESAVVENWREALRLCLSACNDDDVDNVLLAILQPLKDETGTERPRAVLAALCLSDEPNVSEETASKVLQSLIGKIGEKDGIGVFRSGLDKAALELSGSRWFSVLNDYLLEAFFKYPAENRSKLGVLYAMLQQQEVPAGEIEFESYLSERTKKISVCNERDLVGIALTVMILACHGKNCQILGVVDALISRLSGSLPVIHSIIWALAWMNHSRLGNQTWHPDKNQLKHLITIAENPDCDTEALRFSCWIFKRERSAEAVNALLFHLTTSPSKTRKSIVEALGAIGNEQCVSAIKPDLQDSDIDVRRTCLGALAQSCTDKMDRQLLSENFDEGPDWLDPLSRIDSKRINKAAKKLKKPVKEIKERYKALAKKFGLKLS